MTLESFATRSGGNGFNIPDALSEQPDSNARDDVNGYDTAV